MSKYIDLHSIAETVNEINEKNADESTQHVVFNKAYCSSLVCRSSREAMDTGLRPNVSGITDNLAGHFRDMPGLKNWVTVPEFFRHNGYEAIAAG